jgi:hypothetical protein
LNFWKFPFKCGACHQIGHLWEECKNPQGDFVQKRKIWILKKANAVDDMKGSPKGLKDEFHEDGQALEHVLHLVAKFGHPPPSMFLDHIQGTNSELVEKESTRVGQGMPNSNLSLCFKDVHNNSPYPDGWVGVDP